MKLPNVGELKPYPEMKDSGVPWLGEVPEHWEVLPNRTLFTHTHTHTFVPYQIPAVAMAHNMCVCTCTLIPPSTHIPTHACKHAHTLTPDL